MIEVDEQDGVALPRLADGKVNGMRPKFCEALTARLSIISPRASWVIIGTRIFSAGVRL
jgi:hypothetical protein